MSHSDDIQVDSSFLYNQLFLKVEIGDVINAQNIGIFGMSSYEHPWANAFLFTAGGTTKVSHQYGCCSCCQFKDIGNLYPILLPEDIKDELYRCGPSLKVLNALFETSGIFWRAVNVDEGLCHLKDGSCILTPNCD